MKKITRSGKRCLGVVDSNNIFRGTLSDGDIRKAILDGLKFENSISSIYNNNPTILAFRLFSNDSIFLVKIKTKNNKKEPIVVNKINV